VEPGEFSFPTSLAFDPEGNLLVVDQINSRVQMFSRDGEYLDGFGGLGVGFGNFVRPKDVAVDEEGFIYVTDNAFNNVQLFDTDFTLLTFVGEGGRGPGRFHGASGVAVQGPEFAVVDQLGRRVQLFRFLTPKVQ
jgi:DNA-binding beta-propeller fold protein YncE